MKKVFGKGFLITKDTSFRDGNIVGLPIWLFLGLIKSWKRWLFWISQSEVWKYNFQEPVPYIFPIQWDYIANTQANQFFQVLWCLSRDFDIWKIQFGQLYCFPRSKMIFLSLWGAKQYSLAVIPRKRQRRKILHFVQNDKTSRTFGMYRVLSFRENEVTRNLWMIGNKILRMRSGWQKEKVRQDRFSHFNAPKTGEYEKILINRFATLIQSYFSIPIIFS